MDENHACTDQASAGGTAPESTGMAGGAAQPDSAKAAGGGGSPSGEMNAYDIPRYDSQGYIVGRPDAANDPTSAGMVQGTPAEGPQQATEGAQQSAEGYYGDPTQAPGSKPGPQTMGYGTMNSANDQAQQPGMQSPPQGMVYGGMDPAYGQTQPGVDPMAQQPGMQAPPQGMAYGGMDPVYGQAQPGLNPMAQQSGMQASPQGMTYGGVYPAYVQAQPGVNPMGQPGMQLPPQGMVYPGMDPIYGYTQPGYQQPQPEPAAQGINAEQYGRIADMVKDISNGEQPDVNKLVEMFNTFDTAFWKGALIGAVATLLVTNETVKGAIAGTMGGLVGAFNKDSGAVPDTDAT